MEFIIFLKFIFLGVYLASPVAKLHAPNAGPEFYHWSREVDSYAATKEFMYHN